MGSDQKYRLQQSLGYHLSVSARVQERRLDDGLKTLGLTRITWCVLLALGNEGLVHPSEIADFVGIDRTATSRALRQMETAGTIARRAAGDDKRMTSVRLTPAGLDLLERGTPMARRNNAIMEDRLEARERHELRRLLQKLRGGDDVALPRL